MAADYVSGISFSVPQGTFPWQTNFVGLVHWCRWTQAASGAAGRANVGIYPASNFAFFGGGSYVLPNLTAADDAGST